MKNFRLKIAYTLFALFLLKGVKSQVAILYTFSQFTATYQAISTGTVFGNSVSDDVVFVNPTVALGATYGTNGPGLDIGFSFLYNNVRYDRVGVCNDGWITFGHSYLGLNAVNTNASNIFTAISSTSNASPDLQNRVAVFSRDLQGQSGSELRVATIGSSPNRTFVAQWSGYRKYNGSGDSFDFQLRLCETTNVIEFIYGAFSIGAPAATAQVGLRGTTNSDYSNRVTNSFTPWISSFAGNANNSAVYFDNFGLAPAYGLVYRWTPPQCNGPLSALSGTANPSFICANGTSSVQLVNSYTLSGITYTWSSAPSSSGPYTLVANTNSPLYPTGPIVVTTYFRALSTCLNTSSTVTSIPVNVQVAAPVVSSVPYLEGFEGLIVDNQLPNCSWLASNMPSICNTNTAAASNNRIPFAGSKFASFNSGTNPNGDYFYTNGIQLNAGVIYSASVAYVTDGNSGWNKFSMYYGNAQTVSSLTAIDSVVAPTNTLYAQLSHTFSVPTSTVYYMAIKCIGNSSPFFLSFDNVSVITPCALNAPNLTVNFNTATVCSGQSVILAASGANTYSWSNGISSPINTVSPNVATVYSVTGTHTASGCTSVASVSIQVLSSPTLAIGSNTTQICKGDSAYLTANGAISYTWSNTSVGPSILVTPVSTNAYTVYGVNSNACGAFATCTISVIQPPILNIMSSASPVLCLGETATLSATGAANYKWWGPNVFLQSNPVLVKPTTLTTYTIVGTDASSCSNTITFTQDVSLCEGILTHVTDDQIEVYPNPVDNEITILLKSANFTAWDLLNDIGEVILSGSLAGNRSKIDCLSLKSGIYVLKLKTVNNFIVKKIVKN